MAVDCLLETAAALEEMPEEEINKSHLSEIEAFAEMIVHLGVRGGNGVMASGNICLGDGLTEYFKGISAITTTCRFNSLYILYMLFLQFVIDS